MGGLPGVTARLCPASRRLRATRRLDQLRQAQKETVGLSEGTRGSPIKGARVDEKPTLASQGIDKNLAHQAMRSSALSVIFSVIFSGDFGVPGPADIKQRDPTRSRPATAPMRWRRSPGT
jgi:hypothetical protein